MNERVYSHITEDKRWTNRLLFMPEVTHGCIWSDFLGNLLNVNRKVNEHRNIDLRCKTTLPYSTQKQSSDKQKSVIENIEGNIGRQN